MAASLSQPGSLANSTQFACNSRACASEGRRRGNLIDESLDPHLYNSAT